MEVPLKIQFTIQTCGENGIGQAIVGGAVRLINKVEPLNIEARYPSYKERLMKSLTKEYCAELLSQTKELQLWIKNKL